MRRIICAATAKNWARFCQRGAALILQLEVSFIHQRGGLQSVIAALAGHVTVRQAAQFFVNQRHQFIQRLAVAATPLAEQLSHFSWQHFGPHVAVTLS